MDKVAADKWMSSLDELLSPITTEQFFRDHFGRKPLHISGDPERFSYLLTWDDLNRLISCMHGSPSFRLVRAGVDIAPEKYLVRQKSWLSQVSLLDLQSISRELTDGATITINAFEQMHEPVSDLCRILELSLSNYVDVVVFAGWHSSQAFRTHWDHEDVFIVQTLGKKHWRLFQNERRHPTVNDLDVKFNPANCPPYWEGDLSAGDLLYIPSGWWHDVVSTDGETIHVSFGCEFPTGLSLAQQIVDRLSRYEILRATLPRYGTNAEQREYMALFRQAVQEVTQEITLEGFLRDRDAKAPARGRLSLPWSAAPQSQSPPLPSDAWVHWLPPRSASLIESDDELCLEALGRTLKFSAAAAPVLQDLMSCRRTQVHALCARFPNTTIEEFIVYLVTSGLVTITADSSI